jgi:AcrR family transcriptional regulator
MQATFGAFGYAGCMNDAAPVAPRALNKGQRTANRILDAAESLFASHGYAATSLRDIAALAQIQQPGLYKHFTGKEDLYRQVYARALKPMTDLFDSVLVEHGDNGFLTLTDRMTDLLALHPNIARLLLRAAMQPDAERDEIALDWLARLTEYGRKLSAKAGVRSDDGVLAVQIVAIFNMLFGFFSLAPLIERLATRPASDHALVTRQKALLRSFIAGMGEHTNPHNASLIDVEITQDTSIAG